MQLDGQGEPRFAHKVFDNFSTENLWLKISSIGKEWMQVGLSTELRVGGTTLLQSLGSNGQKHMALALQRYHGCRRCLCWVVGDIPGETFPNCG